MSTISPNMNLPISTISVDSGLTWEQNLNAALTLIDQHTHAPGLGALINPSSLDINTDFPVNNNSVTLTKSVRFQQQTPALPAVSPDLGCIYMSGGNLYYNNLSGDQVPITNGASLAGAAGTISGLPSGTASAAYATGTFVFQSATNTAAVIDGRNFILRNSTASSKGLTLTPPSAMAADFNIVLPTLPGATSFLTMDVSGNMSASPALLGALTTTNLSASAGIIGTQLAAGTITATQLASDSVTTVKILNSNVTTAKIADSNVTSAKLASSLTIGGTFTAGTVASTVSTVGSRNVAVSNTNSSGNLAIVAIAFDSAGSIIYGYGATCVRNSTGSYTVTFNSGFGVPPVCTANTTTGGALGAYPIDIYQVTASTVQITVNGGTVDAGFHLHAIGLV